MKLLVLVALLAACEKKPPATSIASIDRTCKADSDCALTGYLGCCDRSCGDNVGTSVNAMVWFKVSARFKPECKEECNVMCPKLPECRDEKYAACKSGTCDIATRKTAACEAEANIDVCETTDDCEVVTLGDDCCDTCGRVMTKRAAAKLREQLAHKCTPDADRSMCPRLDCPRVEGACIDKRCVQL